MELRVPDVPPPPPPIDVPQSGDINDGFDDSSDEFGAPAVHDGNDTALPSFVLQDRKARLGRTRMALQILSILLHVWVGLHVLGTLGFGALVAFGMVGGEADASGVCPWRAVHSWCHHVSPDGRGHHVGFRLRNHRHDATDLRYARVGLQSASVSLLRKFQ